MNSLQFRTLIAVYRSLILSCMVVEYVWLFLTVILDDDTQTAEVVMVATVIQ